MLESQPSSPSFPVRALIAPARTSLDVPPANFAEHRLAKAGIGQFKAQGVLPIDTAADGIGGPAIRQRLHILQHQGQANPGGRRRRLAAGRKQGGILVVMVEQAEGLDQAKAMRAFRKGRMGNTPGFIGNQISRLRVKRIGGCTLFGLDTERQRRDTAAPITTCDSLTIRFRSRIRRQCPRC
jgi:hypothetical protein